MTISDRDQLKPITRLREALHGARTVEVRAVHKRKVVTDRAFCRWADCGSAIRSIGEAHAKFLDHGSTFRYERRVTPRKLTPGEISSAVEKIRKKYDTYASKYFKPRTLREAFEDRYIRALREGVTFPPS